MATGGRLEFLIDPQGSVRIAPATAEARQLKGFIAPAKKAISLEDMQAAIEQTGLDTNVLVRYIVQDDAEQSLAATALIEGGEQAGETFLSTRLFSVR